MNPQPILPLQVYRANAPLTANFVGGQFTGNVTGRNRIALYIRLTKNAGAVSNQAQIRTSWVGSFVLSSGAPYTSLRRDLPGTTVIDDLSLPVISADALFSIGLTNPGGAFTFACGIREIGDVAFPASCEILVSAE